MSNSNSIRCIREYTKKDGSTSFHAEVRRKNAKSLRQSFNTLTKAKNWVRSTESALLEGRSLPDNKARKHTLSDLIEQYKTIHLSKFPDRIKDQSIHLRWWQDQCGEKLLSDITPSLLAKAKELLLNETTIRKIKRSGPTVNRYCATLSTAFTLAFKEWEWISENPFQKVSKLKEHTGRTRFLSKEELNILLEKCKESSNPHLFGIVLIAASMGLRFNEIATLKKRHVDLINGFVTLEKTKNGDIRVVPLPSQVANYLDSLPSKQSEDYLFPSKNPTSLPSNSLIRKAFLKALEQAEIKNFKFHDLRHTSASHLAMNGATQGELMEILGHRSPAMTRRYAHFSNKHIANILQKTSNNLINPQGNL